MLQSVTPAIMLALGLSFLISCTSTAASEAAHHEIMTTTMMERRLQKKTNLKKQRSKTSKPTNQPTVSVAPTVSAAPVTAKAAKKKAAKSKKATTSLAPSPAPSAGCNCAACYGYLGLNCVDNTVQVCPGCVWNGDFSPCSCPISSDLTSDAGLFN